MRPVKRSVLTAMSIALCVILPMAFHSVLNAGKVFLPMHIPVLLCGLICGAPYGLLCGLLGPALSHLLTGMPQLAMLPAMTVECAVFGLTAGLMAKVRTGRLYADLYVSLIAAMVAGRIASGLVNGLIFSAGEYSVAIWLTGAFVTGLPGIIIQLALIPTIVFALMKARILPERY